MKFATVTQSGADVAAIEVSEGRVIPIAKLLDAAGTACDRPRSLQHLIELGRPVLQEIDAALATLAPSQHDGLALEPDAWRPPLPRPGKILAVAMNNSASNARKISAPDHPAFFLKPPSCLIGHREPVRVRPYYGSVHPEPELAVVIGSRMKDAPAAAAMEHVFGYTIFNDITGNGMRAEDRFHYWAVYASKDDPDKTEKVEQHLSYAARYKGTDTFGALGPWIVSRDAIANPDDLSVTCTIHGEPIADDNTRYYNYKVAEVLSFISFFQTLDPGDIVSLGTAFKPGSTRKSIHTANLQIVPGPVEVTIESLGTLTNPVLIEDKPLGEWRL